MATPAELVERKARRELQAADGKVAMAEYLALPKERAANTAKQREARLARDEALNAAKAIADAAGGPPAKKKRKKKTT